MASSPPSLLRPILIVVVLGAFAVPAAGSATMPQTTKLHTLRVFEGGGLAPGFKVRASVQGSCWTESLVESRPYSWRCLHGNYIRDPASRQPQQARPWSVRMRPGVVASCCCG